MKNTNTDLRMNVKKTSSRDYFSLILDLTHKIYKMFFEVYDTDRPAGQVWLLNVNFAR